MPGYDGPFRRSTTSVTLGAMWIRLVIGSVLLASACSTDDGSDQQELGLHDLGECGAGWTFDGSPDWKCEPGCYSKPVPGPNSKSCKVSMHPDFDHSYGCETNLTSYGGYNGCCKAFEDEGIVRFFVCSPEG